MSSLSDLNSLSGLAKALTELESALGALDTPRHNSVDEEALERLKEQLNLVQVICPNHAGVVAARAKWFTVVVSVYQKEVAYAGKKGPKMLQSPLKSMVDHFLRRSYLKEEFARFYQRVEAMYAEFVDLHKYESLNKDAYGFYWLCLSDLRARLLEGKL